MKKVSLKTHPLQERIQAFQHSPLCDIRQQQKGEENKLKKISRNRLPLKEPSLPILNNTIISNKQNTQMATHKTAQHKERSYLKVHTKNLSFFKLRPAQFQVNKSKLSVSQKLNVPGSQNQKVKDHFIKKHVLIRDKKLHPSRNCMSAQIKKQSKQANLIRQIPTIPMNMVPVKQKQFRRTYHLRKSKQLKGQYQTHQIPLLIQAQRLAYEARSLLANPDTNANSGVSLQDFLNEWKSINLH